MEEMACMMSMKTYLKGVQGFRGVFNLGFLLIVEIWHYVQKGSGSTLSSMYFQIFSVSSSSSDLLNLCPGLSALEDTRYIEGYIFHDSFVSILFYDILSFLSVCKSCRLYNIPVGFLYHFCGFGQSMFQWFSDPHLKHIYGFRPLFSVWVILDLRELKYELKYELTLSFLCALTIVSVGCEPLQWLELDCSKFALFVALI